MAREGTSCCLRTDTEPQGERPGPCSAAPPSRPGPVSGPPHAQGSLASSWLPGHAPGSLCQSSWVQTGWGREVPGPSSCEGCVCGMCVCSIAHKTLDQIRQPGRSFRSRGRNLEVWGSRRSSSGPGTVPARASGCSPEEQNRALSPVALQTAPVSVEHSGAHHVRGASLAPQAPREGARIAATLQVVRETGVS